MYNRLVNILDYYFVELGIVMNIENREIMLKSSVGSVNYNLVTADSDKDYKFFVMPTFDDVYDSNYFSKSIVSDTVDYTVHDIRKLPHLIEKGNINFLEVLFAKDIDYNKNYSNMEEILKCKNIFAKANRPYLYDACIGTYYQKMKLLYKGTKGTQKFVDRFGYDTKQAMCAYRMLDFVDRFVCSDWDFGTAIYYEDNTYDKDIIMEIKNGVFTAKEFEKLASQQLSRAECLKKEYKDCKKDTDAIWYLNQLVKKMVMISITGEKQN